MIMRSESNSAPHDAEAPADQLASTVMSTGDSGQPPLLLPSCGLPGSAEVLQHRSEGLDAFGGGGYQTELDVVDPF